MNTGPKSTPPDGEQAPEQGSLKERAIAAVGWNFLDSTGSQLIQFFVTIVMARLLAPELFGVFAMLAVFMLVAPLLIDAGLSIALIQRKSISDIETSSVFVLNIIVAIALAAAMSLTANQLSVFYGEPRLAEIAPYASLVFIGNGLASVHAAILSRNLNFRAHAVANLTAIAVSSAIGIGLALNGFGIWSLVFQQVSNAWTKALLFTWLSPWAVSLRFSATSLGPLLRFGYQLMLSGLLERSCSSLYFVAIGKSVGAIPLGYYSRAHMLQQVPVTSLSGLISKVMLPVLSKVQEDSATLTRAFRKAITLVSLVAFPAMFGLATVADQVVVTLMGQNWAEAGPMLSLLCMVGIFFPLHAANLNVILAHGRSGIFLRLEIFKQSLTLINIALNWNNGITTLIIGQIIATIVGLAVTSHQVFRLIGYKKASQLKDLAPYFVSSLAMAAVILVAEPYITGGQLVQIAIKVLLGVTVYVSSCHFFRLAAYTELKSQAFARLGTVGTKAQK